MDALPADNNLEEIQPVSDDIEERLQRLRNREQLHASALIELCEQVGFFVERVKRRQRKLFVERTTSKS